MPACFHPNSKEQSYVSEQPFPRVYSGLGTDLSSQQAPPHLPLTEEAGRACICLWRWVSWDAEVKWLLQGVLVGASCAGMETWSNWLTSLSSYFVCKTVSVHAHSHPWKFKITEKSVSWNAWASRWRSPVPIGTDHHGCSKPIPIICGQGFTPPGSPLDSAIWIILFCSPPPAIDVPQKPLLIPRVYFQKNFIWVYKKVTEALWSQQGTYCFIPWFMKQF